MQDLGRIDQRFLKDANFREAVLYETVFADLDLSHAHGLGTCIHKGPSVVDSRSLARSHDIPTSFLRGCGLPDSLIFEFQHGGLSARQYWSCFISYSSADQEFADKLYDDLQDQGVRCWFAPEDLLIGAKIRDAIDGAIRDVDRVILILSEDSLSSNWVEKEFETTFEEERRRGESILFPIRLDGAYIKSGRAWVADVQRSLNIGDFTKWRDPEKYKFAFRKLLKALERNDRN